MIYTKKGDSGTTGLYGTKKRVLKSSQIIRAIGAVDEANSYLGIVSSEVRSRSEEVEEIQRDLFIIGAILAGSSVKLSDSRTAKLEAEIDELEAKLPVQKNFILPGGTLIAAHLMYVRTLIRRAEREVVAIDRKSTAVSKILPYINRLSDYLFILARQENFKGGGKETVWRS